MRSKGEGGREGRAYCRKDNFFFRRITENTAVVNIFVYAMRSERTGEGRRCRVR
jgi:hypothetical protein